MKLLLASEATMRSGEGEERPIRKKKKKSEGRKLPSSVGHQSEHPSESITEIRKRKEGARSRLRNTLSQRDRVILPEIPFPNYFTLHWKCSPVECALLLKKKKKNKEGQGMLTSSVGLNTCNRLQMNHGFIC
ncbi:unnamed protein product [Lactuca virosa]|uniref:Uncharacterized protein n=1 Tax=Lactuca virosa TaxID=75947 RepID=A0AAU9LR08_9ASTR|nr:unnamed protein product [Lactuca virosa]